MTDAALTPEAQPSLPARAVRNVLALSAAQALLGGQLMVHIAFGPLAAAVIAPSPAWATVPITVMILTNMAVAAPLSFLTARIGRRPGFLIGVVCAAIAAALSAYAIVIGSFWLFLAASMGFGVYQSCQNLFRFAATDHAPDHFKPKAISYVMLGGLAGPFIGPFIAANFANALDPFPLAGAYAALVGLNVIGAFPLLFLDAPIQRPEQKTENDAAPKRSLWEALSVPGVLPAILCGMVSYATMSLVMTSTSSAMVGCGHSSDQAILVISAHVIAMFAPSFFTGSLIARFGHAAIILTGLALYALCAIVAQTGLGLGEFSVALVLLGVGWNFSFIGASSLLTERHLPEDRARVQAVNEVAVFGLMALASLSSGVLLNAFGWETVTLATLPAVGLAALVVIRTLIACSSDPAGSRPR